MWLQNIINTYPKCVRTILANSKITHNKTATILIIATLAIFVCSISFTLHIITVKRIYTDNLSNELAKYLDQQKFLLQRLGQKLVRPIQQGDFNTVSQTINAYEEVIFSLSKQKLSIPANIHLVSLDAVQQVIGGFGYRDQKILAPDESYYSQVVEEPNSLAVSKLYIKHEMPDYPLLNLGVGITDSANNYYGHLDLKLAVESLQEFFTSHELFNLKFVDNNLLKPKIYYSKTNLMLYAVKFILLRLASIILLITIITWLYKVYKQNLQLKISPLQSKIDKMQKFIDLQHNYGVPSAGNKINLQQLLDDIKALNVIAADQKQIKLVLPEYNNNHHLCFYAHKLRLVQILSGILYEIIMQVSVGGTIELKTILTDYPNDQQKVEFVFNDNGFYEKLQNREVVLSSTDIRSHGWDNIIKLIDLENGLLEHQHVAYVGNTIRFSLVCQAVNNVISLESYCTS